MDAALLRAIPLTELGRKAGDGMGKVLPSRSLWKAHQVFKIFTFHFHFKEKNLIFEAKTCLPFSFSSCGFP